jgi:hypothetical protein
MTEILAFAERNPWGSLLVFCILCGTLVAMAQAFGRRQ